MSFNRREGRMRRKVFRVRGSCQRLVTTETSYVTEKLTFNTSLGNVKLRKTTFIEFLYGNFLIGLTFV